MSNYDLNAPLTVEEKIDRLKVLDLHVYEALGVAEQLVKKIPEHSQDMEAMVIDLKKLRDRMNYVAYFLDNPQASGDKPQGYTLYHTENHHKKEPS
jgi:hypothetical protein